MPKTYINDEVLKNGHHVISIYDAKSQSLLSTYQTTADGKKDGEETEYFKNSKQIKRQTNWKDGQKDGWKTVYDKDGDISTEKEYQKGECIKSRKHKYTGIYGISRFLNKHTQIGRITTEIDEFSGGHGLMVNINGQYVGHTGWMGAHIVEEDGQLKHITVHGLHEIIYDMEFKDNKEYNGYFKIKDTSARYLSDYIYTDGVLEGTVLTDKIAGIFVKGVFSGKKFTNPRKLGSYDASRGVLKGGEYDSYNGYQGYIDREVRGYHVYENGKHTKDCVEVSARWNSYGCGTDYREFYSEPKKDGKLQGEYIHAQKNIKAYYKDGKLDGEYIEFFDRIDGNKKVEGSYKNGKKDGFWKYYSKDGKVINQEYYRDGKNCTAKYNRLKNIASKRIEEEKAIEVETGVKTRLPKMSKEEKKTAIRDEVITTVKKRLGISK